jgi:hypothetical protein
VNITEKIASDLIGDLPPIVCFEEINPLPQSLAEQCQFSFSCSLPEGLEHQRSNSGESISLSRESSSSDCGHIVDPYDQKGEFGWSLLQTSDVNQSLTR